MVELEPLSRVSLFADLDGPHLEEVAHILDDERFADGSRVVHEGIPSGGFYVMLEGTASIVAGGVERAILKPGDFFGEVSILLGGPAIADVVAVGELRCAVANAGDLRPLLQRFPSIAVRMLEAGARRLRAANEWQP
jgi:CRP-like cAMP-binding protein